MDRSRSLYNRSIDWRTRLGHIVEMMRDISRHSDPHTVAVNYGRRVRELEAFDRYLSLSRRELQRPRYRITRDSTWREPIDPWKQRERLPLLEGGLLADIIYSNEPAFIEDLRVEAGDPAATYLEGYRTLIGVPHFDHGESLNMVIHLRREPGINHEELPELVWESCLFGRLTYSLRLAAQLKDAYAELDRELAIVGELQRSLLPDALPRVPGLGLAASYQTSRRAGGDSYDVFPLADGRWGIMIADVSGHGTPAAVLMAIVHALAHACEEAGAVGSPGAFLGYLNDRLVRRYSRSGQAFVTALYVVYDPCRRTLVAASAGHNPARLLRAAPPSVAPSPAVGALSSGLGLPLGIREAERYVERTTTLSRGDVLLMYTDGIIEARRDGGEMFGVERLDEALGAPPVTGNAASIVHRVLGAVEAFTGGAAAEDDRTVLVAVAEG
jgi:sigma-B regulation protein RsbU (phosphoserine phosphatase)